MNTLWANVVMAGVNQGHCLWERWQLGDVVFSDHHLLQFRQTHKCSVLDGRYLVASQVDPLQLVWRNVRKHKQADSDFSVALASKLRLHINVWDLVHALLIKTKTYSWRQSQTCWSFGFCCSERRSEWCLWGEVVHYPASSHRSRPNCQGTCTASKWAYLEYTDEKKDFSPEAKLEAKLREIRTEHAGIFQTNPKGEFSWIQRCSVLTFYVNYKLFSLVWLIGLTGLWYFRAHWPFYSASTLLRGFCCRWKQLLLLLETRLGVKIQVRLWTRDGTSGKQQLAVCRSVLAVLTTEFMTFMWQINTRSWCY